MPEQKIVNEHMLKLSKELQVGLVATNDVHYLTHEDNQAHDILLCIGNNKKYNDENRQRYSSDQFYLKSPQEMSELFKDYPDAISNTVKIAEQCNVELGSTSLMPIYPFPEGYTSETYLRMLCYEGLNNRYKSITQEHKDRLEYELKVICDMGFAGYFLIVWDVIIWSRKHGISVGPGRGSVAGSLVSYVLGITNLCPLKYNLIFERFLNPERISMPDIDTDFADTRRPEVINYVIDKYGKR